MTMLIYFEPILFFSVLLVTVTTFVSDISDAITLLGP